jgi:hypothetical protein
MSRYHPADGRGKAIDISFIGNRFACRPRASPFRGDRIARAHAPYRHCAACASRCSHATYELKRVSFSGIVHRIAGFACIIAGSSNGRTPASGAGYLGSNPSPAANERSEFLPTQDSNAKGVGETVVSPWRKDWENLGRRFFAPSLT